MRKYEYTGLMHSDLYQIRAMRDIPLHGVKRGDLGGFVYPETLSHSGSAWVGGEAKAYGKVVGNALVTDTALIRDRAEILGSARVMGSATVSAQASVSGRACISGNACIGGHAVVSGHASVKDNAQIVDYAWIDGHAEVCGSAIILGHTRITGHAHVSVNLTQGTYFGYRTLVDPTLWLVRYREALGLDSQTLVPLWVHWIFNSLPWKGVESVNFGGSEDSLGGRMVVVSCHTSRFDGLLELLQLPKSKVSFFTVHGDCVYAAISFHDMAFSHHLAYNRVMGTNRPYKGLTLTDQG